MRRISYALFALITVTAVAPLRAADDTPGLDAAFADPAERDLYLWLVSRTDKKPHVEMKNGKVAWVGLEGENLYQLSLHFDDDRRVVKLVCNQAGFHNDELEKLAGFKRLKDITAWHNFRHGELNAPGENLASCAGLAAFRSGVLESVNFGGGKFDRDGVAAIVAVPTLKNAKIYHTRVDDEACTLFANDTHIEYLNLGPQFSMRITDAALEPIGTMKAIKHLELNETRFTWAGLQHLAKLKGQLEKIEFKQAWIDEADLAKLRDALPGTTIEYTPADDKQMEQLKNRIEQASKSK